MKAGAYFYKHDYGRAKRGRKWLGLSNDGLSLKWRAVGNTEVVQPGDGSSASSRGGTSSRGSFGSGGGARGLMKSASFSRFSSGARQAPPPPDQTARGRACAAARPVLHLARLRLTLRRAHCARARAGSSPLGRLAHHLRAVHGHLLEEDGARPRRRALGLLLARAPRVAHARPSHRGRERAPLVAARVSLLALTLSLSLTLSPTLTLALTLTLGPALALPYPRLQQLIVYFSPDKTSASARSPPTLSAQA